MKKFKELCNNRLIKKIQRKYLRSLSKQIKYGLLTLNSVRLSNEQHISDLPRLISSLEDAVNDVNKQINLYKKYIK